jgi:DNA-binding CsgD family transcriptional regulator
MAAGSTPAYDGVVPRDTIARVRQDLAVLAHSGLEWPSLALRASAAIKRALRFEKACWHTIDPSTHLLTGAVKEGIERDDPRLPRYEATIDDVNKFAFLAGCSPPVGVLSRATHGNLRSSPRFRDLLEPLGIAWEVRVVFTVDGTAWGACSLYRSPGQPDFTDRDAELLAGVSRVLGEGFRRSLLLHGQVMSDAPDGPGLILLDDDDATVSITPAAVRWLEEVVDVGVIGDRRLPAPVYSVAARARAISSAPVARGLQARARAFTRSGRWLLLYGAQLTGRRERLTSVIIEPAQPREVALLILHAHGLSERERDIAQLVLRGRSTTEMADELHLSSLTVQGYLKSIFDKTGVRSRRQLVARIAGSDAEVSEAI